jgi:hypothetical protein
VNDAVDDGIHDSGRNSNDGGDDIRNHGIDSFG